MNQKEIHDLVKLISKTEISEFKLKDKDFAISIRTAKYVSGKMVATAPVVQHTPATPAPAAPAASASEQTAAPAAKADESKKEETGDDSKYEVFKSPMVGTFYRKPSPDKEMFVQVGDSVKKGSVLCVIEAMKLFNEIECEISGTIVKVLVDDASPVEYDQPLFLIDPA